MGDLLTGVGITGIPALAVVAVAWIVSRAVERATARREAAEGSQLRQVEARLTAALEARTALDVDLREHRVAAYGALWRRGVEFARWPRNGRLTHGEVQRLHRELRDWYFAELGGMWLSAPARQAYGQLQEELARFEGHPETLPVPHDEAAYQRVLDAFSALRSELTADLQSRVRTGATAPPDEP